MNATASRWGNLLWPRPRPHPRIESLQAKLYRRLLAATLVVLLLFYLRELQDPHLPPLLLPLGLAGTLAAWAAAEAWSWSRSASLVLLTLVFAVLMAWEARQWGTAVVPSLNFLPLLGGLITLVAAPRLGVLMSIFSLGLLLGLGLGLPHHLQEETHALLALSLAVIAMQTAALLFYRVFSRLEDRLLDQQARLARAVEDARVMDRALVAQLRAPLSQLKALLQGPAGLEGAALIGPVTDMAVCLGDAKGLAQPGQTDAKPFEVDLGRAGRSLARLLMDIGAGNYLILAVYSLLVDHHGLHALVLATLAAALAWLGRSPLTPSRQGQVLALLFLAFSLYRVATFNGHFPVPTTPFQGLIVLILAMLGGWWTAMTYSAVLVAFTLWACTLGGLPYLVEHSLLTMLGSVILVLVVAGGCLGMHQALLLREQEQGLNLGRALRLRRRLLGTLFHDLANPLTVVAMASQVDPGQALDARQQARLVRMCGRIEALLESAHEFLQGEESVPADRLELSPLGPLLEEVAELFEHRLRSKQQDLKLSLEPGLSVRTLPVVLRESVLANLVGNAVKFSPVGGRVDLSLRASGDQLLIEVRDQGPGYPVEVLRALAHDERVATRDGTQGEAGYGLGLGLVKEYLGRLGGSLELENMAQGACARVRLPLA